MSVDNRSLAVYWSDREVRLWVRSTVRVRMRVRVTVRVTVNGDGDGDGDGEWRG